MEKLIRFLEDDRRIQLFLIAISTLFGLLVYPLGIMLPIIGGWQLISACYVSYKLKDPIRINYLIFSFCYISAMIGLTILYDVSFFMPMIPSPLMELTFIITPICIALWYFRLTSKTLKEIKENKDAHLVQTKDLEHILDADEMFN